MTDKLPVPRKTDRLAGHGLRHEGAAFTAPGRRASAYSGDDSGPGMALCGCGMHSPVIQNRRQRKLWHRDHKADIRAGGNGQVWQGVDQP